MRGLVQKLNAELSELSLSDIFCSQRKRLLNSRWFLALNVKNSRLDLILKEYINSSSKFLCCCKSLILNPCLLRKETFSLNLDSKVGLEIRISESNTILINVLFF